MGEFSSYNDAKLLKEVELLKEKIENAGETVFMRMLHELKVYQLELELQNRTLLETRLELEESRDRYAELYDFAPLAYFTFDVHGSILELNLAGASLLGREKSGLLGMPFINFIARHGRSNFLAYVRECILGSGKESIEFELALPDGKLIKVNTANIGKQLVNGKIDACRMAFIEVTEHRIAELKLRLTSKVLENTEEGIILTDAQQRIVAANPAFLKMTGYDSREIIGFTPAILKSGHHDEKFFQEMHAAFKENNGWQGEIWNRHKNGEVSQQWANIQVIRKNDGEVDCYIGIYSDISNVEVMKRRLKELAYYDDLTGLANRSLLYDRLQHELVQARREGSMLVVMFLDLDRLKETNERYGGAAGDLILKQIAERLTYCLRQGDTLSRLDGDEFVAILPGIESAEVLEQIAARMMKAMARPFLIGDVELLLTNSIGISIFPRDGDDMTGLLRNADVAMCHAKGLGRSNFQFYDVLMTHKKVMETSKIYHD